MVSPIQKKGFSDFLDFQILKILSDYVGTKAEYVGEKRNMSEIPLSDSQTLPWLSLRISKSK